MKKLFKLFMIIGIIFAIALYFNPELRATVYPIVSDLNEQIGKTIDFIVENVTTLLTNLNHQ